MAHTEQTTLKDLTVSEFVDLIETAVGRPPQLLRGIKEICAFLGISKSAFYRLRDNEPSFDKAIIQYSYIVIADPNKVLAALTEISDRNKFIEARH